MNRKIYVNVKTQCAALDKSEISTSDLLYYKPYRLVGKTTAHNLRDKVMWLSPVCQDCSFCFTDDIPMHKDYPGSCKDLLGEEVNCDADALPYIKIRGEVCEFKSKVS